MVLDLGESAHSAVEAVDEIIQRCLQDFPSEPAVDHLQLLEQKICGSQLARLDARLIEREATAMVGAITRRAVGEQVSQKLGNAIFPDKLATFNGDWFEAGIALATNLGTDNDVWQQYGEVTEQFVALFGHADKQPKPPLNANFDDLPHRVRNLLGQARLSSERAHSAGDMLEYLTPACLKADVR